MPTQFLYDDWEVKGADQLKTLGASIPTLPQEKATPNIGSQTVEVLWPE